MVLVFRHVPFEPAGMIADALDLHGFEWRYVDLWSSTQQELPVNPQAVVSMGGPMSVNDSLPWLRLEEQFLTQAIANGVPVLGICLGAQLLAKCLGTSVHRMMHREIGWYPVRFTETGLGDPLFAGLQAQETFFHWHGETFDLPEGAEHLASSDLCANQAFRSGSSLYGIQFHPEVTPEIIRSWCEEDENCGELREAQTPVDPEAHRDHMRQVAGRVFGGWCELIAAK